MNVEEKEGITGNRRNSFPSKGLSSTKGSKNKYIIKRRNNELLYACHQRERTERTDVNADYKSYIFVQVGTCRISTKCVTKEKK